MKVHYSQVINNNPVYDYTNNIYYLKTGNVGIGVPNDTKLTHKLVVNGENKSNNNFFLNDSLEIQKINSSSVCNLAIYNDDTTIKEQCSVYLSNLSDVFVIDTDILSTRTTSAIEIRCTGDPIIQVYCDKVDIT